MTQRRIVLKEALNRSSSDLDTFFMGTTLSGQKSESRKKPKVMNAWSAFQFGMASNKYLPGNVTSKINKVSQIKLLRQSRNKSFSISRKSSSHKIIKSSIGHLEKMKTQRELEHIVRADEKFKELLSFPLLNSLLSLKFNHSSNTLDLSQQQISWTKKVIYEMLYYILVIRQCRDFNKTQEYLPRIIEML